MLLFGLNAFRRYSAFVLRGHKKNAGKKPIRTQPIPTRYLYLHLCIFICAYLFWFYGMYVITREPSKAGRKDREMECVSYSLAGLFSVARLIIISECVLCAFWLLCPLLTFVFKKFLSPLRFHSIRRMIFVGLPTKNYMFHFLWRPNSPPLWKQKNNKNRVEEPKDKCLDIVCPSLFCFEISFRGFCFCFPHINQRMLRSFHFSCGQALKREISLAQLNEKKPNQVIPWILSLFLVLHVCLALIVLFEILFRHKT